MTQPAYIAGLIRPVKWAAVAPNPDGTWTAVWHISFQEQFSLDRAVLDDLARTCDDEFFGFHVRFDVQSEHDLCAVATTPSWSMDDPYYLLTYRMFTLLNQEIGRISAIEEQPRDWWSPFRGWSRSSADDWEQQIRELRRVAASSIDGAS